MTTIVIRLHPAEVLNANQRMHWACKARLTSNLRDWGSFAWNRAGRPHMNRAHVTVTLGYPDRRKRDAHNLMATVKPLLDGIAAMTRPARGLGAPAIEPSVPLATHTTRSTRTW